MRCSQGLFNVLVILVPYLWLTGGKGWISATQFANQRPMKLAARLTNYLLWPLFAVVAIVGELIDNARH